MNKYMSQSENDFQNNYAEGQNYKFRNLCDTCTQLIPECNGTKIKFGDDIGNDNVIECDGYIKY